MDPKGNPIPNTQYMVCLPMLTHEISQMQVNITYIERLGIPAIKYYLVVSNIFYFQPYLGKIPNLTNIFQRGLKPPTSVCLGIPARKILLGGLKYFFSPLPGEMVQFD